MCTAIFDNKFGGFFGRTLDLEYSLGQEVIKTEKGTPLSFMYEGEINARFSYIGMAHRARREVGGEKIPLYFDGMNECGLAVAALNFFGFARYNDRAERCRNLASFEVVPYLLSSCGNVDCVRKLLSCANITADAFSESLPPTPLHFMVADRERSIVIEQTAKGLEIYDDPVGVMTNSPGFDYHMLRLADYSALSAKPPENTLCEWVDLPQYSRGLGGVGLPGDFSSSSRFIRAVFLKNHTLMPSEAFVQKGNESLALDRFLHIISGVSVPLGCIMTNKKMPVCTVYTSACDLDNLTYHYFSYSDRTLRTFRL
ncbi:MAG: choloylglycine hydrolase family protein [Clostridia bacterium]|nr:choloylglycine hydrolase family protein [Clostridia bacterium]